MGKYKNENYMKEYYLSNKEVIKERSNKNYHNNRLERLEVQKEWASNNKERTITYKRKWKLANIYGITEEDYQNKLIEQNHSCAICGSKHSKNIKNKKLYIDHDHKTGKFRGILCSNCNSGLGKFEDNAEFLNSAIQYLKQNNDK